MGILHQDQKGSPGHGIQGSHAPENKLHVLLLLLLLLSFTNGLRVVPSRLPEGGPYQTTKFPPERREKLGPCVGHHMQGKAVKPEDMVHFAEPVDHGEYGGVPIQAGQACEEVQSNMATGVAGNR